MFSDAITKAYADSKYGRKILVSSTPISINSSGDASEYSQKFDLNLSEELYLNDPDTVGFEIVFNSDFNVAIDKYTRDFSVSIIVSNSYTSNGIVLFCDKAVTYRSKYVLNGSRIFRSIEFMPTYKKYDSEVYDAERYLAWNIQSGSIDLGSFDSNKLTNDSKIRVLLEKVSSGSYTFNADFTVNIYKLYY